MLNNSPFPYFFAHVEGVNPLSKAYAFEQKKCSPTKRLHFFTLNPNSYFKNYN